MAGIVAPALAGFLLRTARVQLLGNENFERAVARYRCVAPMAGIDGVETMMTDITLDAQIACVKRELKLREVNYPKFIERKSMRPDEAAKEIAKMTAVLRTLEELKREGGLLT